MVDTILITILTSGATVGAAIFTYLSKKTKAAMEVRLAAMSNKNEGLKKSIDNLEDLAMEELDILNRIAGILLDISKDIDQTRDLCVRIETQLSGVSQIQVAQMAADVRRDNKGD